MKGLIILKANKQSNWTFVEVLQQATSILLKNDY